MNRRDLLNPTQLTFFDQLKALYERIDDAFIADLDRSVSFGDVFVDRWERASKLGFGERTNIYDSSLVIGDVKVGTETRNGEDVTTELNFSMPGGFDSSYRVIVSELVDAQIKTASFRGANWNVDIMPTQKAIKDLQYFAGILGAFDPLLTARTVNGNLVFFIGVSCLLFVPFFKVITALPPYMGMLCSLGIMWVLTELMHHKNVTDEKGSLSVSHALRKIDTPSILFFLGILMSIAALEQVGLLTRLAAFFDHEFSDIKIIAIVIGLLSSVVDNVPMVAALQSMYSLDMYPTDHYFWEFLAYTAGTGGSVLIIGSAAGVAVMGIEKIDFFWYLKNISWIALIGFITGALVFILENA